MLAAVVVAAVTVTVVWAAVLGAGWIGNL